MESVSKWCFKRFESKKKQQHHQPKNSTRKDKLRFLFFFDFISTSFLLFVLCLHGLQTENKKMHRNKQVVHKFSLIINVVLEHIRTKEKKTTKTTAPHQFVILNRQCVPIKWWTPALFFHKHERNAVISHFKTYYMWCSFHSLFRMMCKTCVLETMFVGIVHFSSFNGKYI